MGIDFLFLSRGVGQAHWRGRVRPSPCCPLGTGTACSDGDIPVNVLGSCVKYLHVAFSRLLIGSTYTLRCRPFTWISSSTASAKFVVFLGTSASITSVIYFFLFHRTSEVATSVAVDPKFGTTFIVNSNGTGNPNKRTESGHQTRANGALCTG